MNTISGTVVLVATAALFFFFRPKAKTSLGICTICVLMGLITPIVPANTWFLQVLSLATKGVALGCCYVQLSRESRQRKAETARARRAAEREKIRKIVELDAQIRPSA